MELLLKALRGEKLSTAQKIKLLAQQKQMSLKELSARADCDPSSLTRFFSNKSDMTFSTLNKVLSSLGIDLDEILNRELNLASIPQIIEDKKSSSASPVHQHLGIILDSFEGLQKKILVRQVLSWTKTVNPKAPKKSIKFLSDYAQEIKEL